MADNDIFDKNTTKLMIKALVVAVILSVILVAYLLWIGSQERYSMIYIYPDSYSNYVKVGGNVSFRYGIYCHEGKESTYIVKIYVGDKLLKTKKVVLENGESWEKNETVNIPKDVTLPVKLRVVAEVDGRAYEAYFWLKEMRAQ